MWNSNSDCGTWRHIVEFKHHSFSHSTRWKWWDSRKLVFCILDWTQAVVEASGCLMISAIEYMEYNWVQWSTRCFKAVSVAEFPAFPLRKCRVCSANFSSAITYLSEAHPISQQGWNCTWITSEVWTIESIHIIEQQVTHPSCYCYCFGCYVQDWKHSVFARLLTCTVIGWTSVLRRGERKKIGKGYTYINLEKKGLILITLYYITLYYIILYYIILYYMIWYYIILYDMILYYIILYYIII